MKNAVRLCLSILLVVAASGAAEAQSRWHDKVRAFRAENARLDPARKNVVLFGSSSMEGWKQGSRVANYLPTVGPRALNRGISGDGIGLEIGPGKKGLRNRLKDSVLDANPSHVFIFNGRNSLWAGAERVANAYRSLIREIKAELPDVVICVITVPPTNYRYATMNPKIVDYNARLLQIAQDEGCWWIDLYPHLVGPDGRLRPSMTGDGLHMRNAGYEILGRGIERVVRQSEAAAREAAEATAEPTGDGSTEPTATPEPADGPAPPCPTDGALEALRRLLGQLGIR